ncbi:DegT/DnrJ/EryC1/StrS family aminotransferase [Nocardioides zeicaulis]|uniref:DegT/DnrJ/EryC1/StrS family aminotransferase n=1 Tax=Nocardioides zeicaulis TaxID=1776857 RepID=A0ABV6DZV5_9ACTN
MSPDIPFIRPSLPETAAVAAAYERIVEANWFTNFGPTERELARLMAEAVGPHHHTSTFANATLALVGALSGALGRGDGTRFVLVPSFTFAAGPQAVVWSGHRVAFVDVDPVTWQPDAAHARALLETVPGEVAGILLGNTLGVGNAAVAEWERLAADHDLPLVIDSAAGFGSWYDDERRVGDAGTCEVFSLHVTKPFGIGEGGAVLSRDAELVAWLDRFQNFGFSPGREAEILGLNGKLPELSAAIGLLQLERLEGRLAERRRVLATYVAELAPLGLTPLPNSERAALGSASLRARDPGQRDQILAALTAAGVQARAYYNPPVHRHPWFVEHDDVWAGGALPATEALCSEVLSLPIHDEMSEADLGRVIEAVQSCR